MTLLELVKQECCNLVSNICLGVDTRHGKFRDEGKCWVQEGKPCGYFERTVLPLEKSLRAKYDLIIKEG